MSSPESQSPTHSGSEPLDASEPPDTSSGAGESSDEESFDEEPMTPDAPGCLRVPGFGRPVDAARPSPDFENPFDDVWVSMGITLREKRMMAFVDAITDKPEWELKVFDEAIVAKWRAEADVRPENLGGDVMLSEQMFDFVSLVARIVVWPGAGLMWTAVHQGTAG